MKIPIFYKPKEEEVVLVAKNNIKSTESLEKATK